MTKLSALSSFLTAFLAVGCGSSKQDSYVYDTAMNRDIQLARQDSIGQPMLADTSAPVMITRTTIPYPPGTRPVEQPSAGTRLQDTDTVDFRNTSLSGASTAAESVAIETQLKNLRAASISFWAPDTLFISRPERVSVIIDPKRAPRAPRIGRPQIQPSTTRISSRTQVCLAAPGLKVNDDEGTDKNCRTQVVAFSAPSQWHWTVTALPEIKHSDTRRINVTVNAYLDTFPPYTVYTTHHQAYVHVDDPGLLERIKVWLSTWQAIAASITVIVGAITAVLTLLSSRRKKRAGTSRPNPPEHG